MKKVGRLFMKFFLNPSTNVHQVPQPPISKSAPSYSVLRSFFKENFNLHARIDTVATEYGVYTP